jgi:hypothetical protein
MRVIYNQSQDITLKIPKDEFNRLISKQSKDFFDDNVVRALSAELGTYLYLGHCKNNLLELMAYRHTLEGGIQIVLPDELEDSYFINLPPESEVIKELNKKGNYSARYPGGSKIIFIINEENIN